MSSHWECLRCGERNESFVFICGRCELDKESALVWAVPKILKYCEECDHVHREDVYCHCFMEAADEDDDDDDISESDSDQQSDLSEEESLSLTKKKVEEPGKMQKAKPLDTPHFVRRIKYIRCNCNIGVPSASKRFHAIPKYVFVGNIQIQTFAEIIYSSDRARHKHHLAERFPESGLQRRHAQRLADIAANLPHIMSFLPLSMCSPIPQVSTYWNHGACQHQEFVDMRNCVPWQAYRAHGGQVDSILLHGQFVYSGGDRRVLASRYETAEVTSTITRDSGSIPFLFEKEQELYICSSNGAIRIYGLTHTGRNIESITTMWEHSKPLLHVIQSLPSTGRCSMHGIDEHVCTLYTCSSDRTINQWDVNKHTPVRCIESRAMRSSTFMRLAQSDRHIFAGTSTATVAVFCKQSRCERDDIHTCNIPGSDQSYCLQLSLKLPPITLKSGNPAAVTGLICVDVTFPFSHLWAADSSGQLTVWHVPDEGLGFIPAHTVKAHDGPINNLVHTQKHAISISDDGYVVLLDLLHFDRIRSINIVEWASLYGLLQRPDVSRKIKCVSLQEDHENGGMMAVGTSYGDIILLRLGTTV